ncbi:MAG: hypothetical protein WDW38_007137 [Sanguina aurantia]
MKRGIDSYFSRIPKKQAAAPAANTSPASALASQLTPRHSSNISPAAAATGSGTHPSPPSQSPQPPSQQQPAGSARAHAASKRDAPFGSGSTNETKPAPAGEVGRGSPQPISFCHTERPAQTTPASPAAAAAAAADPPAAGPGGDGSCVTETVAHTQEAALVAAPAAAAAAPAAAATTDSATKSAGTAAAAAGALAVAPPVALDPASLRELACRNQDLVSRALATASAAGTPPEVRALLTEPSWKAALSGVLGGSKARSLQASGHARRVPTGSCSLAAAIHDATTRSFLHKEWASSAAVFPPKESIFRALNACPLDQVRVVILGQDPYHGSGEAMGFSFSVPRGVKVPSSLSNMFKELGADVGFSRPGHGCLEAWAHQGVLMLNTLLTVRSGAPLSHAKQGWEVITDAAISAISARRRGVVFMMWGKTAQDKMTLIDLKKHHVLTTSHPSGLSASRGFIGCRHFSKANAILIKAGLPPVQWQL